MGEGAESAFHLFQLTPLVLMQQIVVAVQVVEDAGPQTCPLPVPEQQ